MMRVISAQEDVFAILRKRSVARDAQTQAIVAAIIEDVRHRGDAALVESARKFDAPDLTSVVVSAEEIAEAHVSEPHLDAIRVAISRIRSFHQAQLDVATAGMTPSERGWTWKREAGEAAFLGQRYLPVVAAGAYVPGGNAAYPSSVMMNAIPAQVAGVERIAVTTPARRDGSLPTAVLVALREVGIHQAYKVGGAAAITALALGTESIERVDQIVGPGNRFVNEAKRQLWGQVGLDGYAGPSEVCVLADDSADAAMAAADLITQVEHAPDNAGFLIAISQAKLDEIVAEVERQIAEAPRQETIRAALANESLAIVATDLSQAIDIVNAIAPEHLTAAIRDPEAVLGRLQNAGCVLLGEWTPESAGDYCLGPSHTLPTSGAARFGSPVNVLDFIKIQSLSRMSPASLMPLIPVIEAFGEMEGFPAHAYGATVRRGR